MDVSSLLESWGQQSTFFCKVDGPVCAANEKAAEGRPCFYFVFECLVQLYIVALWYFIGWIIKIAFNLESSLKNTEEHAKKNLSAHRLKSLSVEWRKE